MWLDWLVFCDCGFSLSALWCPLSAPTISLRFFLPCTWGISSWPLLLTLGVGYLLLAARCFSACSRRSPLAKQARIQIKISLDIFFALFFFLVLLFSKVSKGFRYTILKFISSSLAFSKHNVKYWDGQKICSGFSEKPRWTFWPPQYLKIFTFII